MPAAANEACPSTERKDSCGADGLTARPTNCSTQFQRSFSFDRRLLPYELAVDRAWAGAAESAGILSTRRKCATR